MKAKVPSVLDEVMKLKGTPAYEFEASLSGARQTKLASYYLTLNYLYVFFYSISNDRSSNEAT